MVFGEILLQSGRLGGPQGPGAVYVPLNLQDLLTRPRHNAGCGYPAGQRFEESIGQQGIGSLHFGQRLSFRGSQF